MYWLMFIAVKIYFNSIKLAFVITIKKSYGHALETYAYNNGPTVFYIYITVYILITRFAKVVKSPTDQPNDLEFKSR